MSSTLVMQVKSGDDLASYSQPMILPYIMADSFGQQFVNPDEYYFIGSESRQLRPRTKRIETKLPEASN